MPSEPSGEYFSTPVDDGVALVGTSLALRGKRTGESSIKKKKKEIAKTRLTNAGERGDLPLDQARNTP